MDALSKAERALRSMNIPDGPSPEAMSRAVSSALQEADSAPPPLARSRRSYSGRRSSIMSVAAIVATLLIVAGVLSLVGPRESLAFQELTKPFREAQTVVYESVLKPTAETGGAEVRSKHYQKHPGLQRVEHGDGSIMISDWNQRLLVSLEPNSRTALIMTDLQVGEHAADQNQTKAVVEWLRQAEATGEPIAARDLNGISAPGFRAQMGPVEISIWGDPQTKLPLLVEMPFSVGAEEYLLQMSSFEFDRPLDEALFSTDPPAGYQVETRAAPVADLSRVAALSPEEHVASLLKFYSGLFDGQFPKAIDDPGLTATMIERLSAEGELTPAQEAALYEVVPSLGAIWTYRQSLDGFGYASDVKLGDKDRIVFWYRPEGAESYRAVFGDLRVEDVVAERVPN